MKQVIYAMSTLLALTAGQYGLAADTAPAATQG